MKIVNALKGRDVDGKGIWFYIKRDKELYLMLLLPIFL